MFIAGTQSERVAQNRSFSSRKDRKSGDLCNFGVSDRRYLLCTYLRLEASSGRGKGKGKNFSSR